MNMSEKRAAVLLADGYEEGESLFVVDILRRTGVACDSVSIEGEMVRGCHDIYVKADRLISPDIYDDYDMVIIPGGMPGAANLDACEPLRQGIMAHYEAGKPLAAICAAPLVYGHMGLLRGVRATCYPGFETHLEGATYTAAIVEQDGQFVTGKGPAAAFEFGYTIAELFLGHETVEPLRQGMIYAELTA